MFKIEGKNILSKKASNYSLNNFLKEGRQIAINNDYVAMTMRKSGQICLLNSYDPDIKYKSIQKEEKYNIVDLEFSPFEKNILSLSYDNKQFISLIQFEPSKNITKSDDLYHKSNITLKNFNPNKKNILCSCTNDGIGYIWDINIKKKIFEFETGCAPPRGVIWDPYGVHVGICSQRELKIFDKNEKIFENIISDEDILINSFDWIDEFNIVTIGWEKKEQKIKMYDLRNNKSNYEELIITNKKDKNNINPFVNQEMKLIYTVRKEENISSNPSMIVYYLNQNKKLEKIYEHSTPIPGACTVLLKNKSSENKHNEINRFARYSSKENKIYYVSFTNKSLNFYTDIKNDLTINTINKIIEKDDNDKNINKIEEKKENEINMINNNKKEKQEEPNKNVIENKIEKNKNNQNENIEQLKTDLENQKKLINEILSQNDILIKNNKQLEQDNINNQNMINKLKEQVQLEQNLQKKLNKNLDEIKLEKIEKEKLYINIKEKIEEIDKEIYKKDLIIQNKISEIKNLKEDVNNLLSNKIENENELNKYKQLLEEKDKEINQIKNNNNIDINNLNINSFRISNYEYYNQMPNKDISFICLNSQYLEGYIKLTTEKYSFELFLKNDGNKQWYNNTILKNDTSSDFNIQDIPLDPLKPNEEKNFKINLNNIKNYQAGRYKIIFVFESAGMIFGNKLIYELTIYDYNMINKFRQKYKLEEKVYPDEKVYRILKKNYFNFDNAFNFKDIE